MNVACCACSGLTKRVRMKNGEDGRLVTIVLSGSDLRFLHSSLSHSPSQTSIQNQDLPRFCCACSCKCLTVRSRPGVFCVWPSRCSCKCRAPLEVRVLVSDCTDSNRLMQALDCCSTLQDSRPSARRRTIDGKSAFCRQRVTMTTQAGPLG